MPADLLRFVSVLILIATAANFVPVNARGGNYPLLQRLRERHRLRKNPAHALFAAVFSGFVPSATMRQLE